MDELVCVAIGIHDRDQLAAIVVIIPGDRDPEGVDNRGDVMRETGVVIVVKVRHVRAGTAVHQLEDLE
jgi:hypothetical protein